MGCCGTIIKYLLFIFNLVFVLCGIALIAVGAVLLTNVDEFADVAEQLNMGLRAPQITLIVLGSFIFIIAFMGCCGAIRENKCMLITFGVSMLLIFVVQLAIGIYAVVNFSEDNVTKKLDRIFQTHSEDSIAMFDTLQEALQCCGVRGSADYGLNKWPVPQSCVQNPASTDRVLWPQGCGEALTDWVVSAKQVLGGVAIGLSVIEIIGACCAFYQVKRSPVFRKNLFKS